MLPTTDSKLIVKDCRDGKESEIAIENDSINATDFQKHKLRVLDYSYQNTAVVKSKISFIDGEKGILEYRGYSIEELAQKSSFLEVSFLLIYGELPTASQLKEWTQKVMTHTFVHTRLTEMMKTFNYDAHPMGMFISSIAAMSTFHSEANPALQGSDLYVNNQELMNKQIVRILGKAPTVAAAAYRHRIGRPFNLPRNDLDYCENLLYMMDKLADDDAKYKPNKRLAKVLDVMFILHAEHEMNCSTAAMRHIASSRVDPYSAIAGAASALYGPLHGGANEAVLKMLKQIGSVENVAMFIEAVKKKEKRLMGFGHRVYHNYDPRAKLIRNLAYEVFEICGKDPLIKVAVALEKEALSDQYFKKRNLYPNVDFYSGLIYNAMGFPTDFFPLLFAIPRITGWLSHWREEMEQKSPKIWRPRQIYIGERHRKYEGIQKRSEKSNVNIQMSSHPFNRRYLVSKL